MSKLAFLYLSHINVRFIILLVNLMLFSYNVFSNGINNNKLKTIVIDPGHGGKDPGTLGTKRYSKYEKDIALSVSLKLGNYISNSFPDIKVVYTRKEDVFLELNERTRIANKSNADIFISVHCDGFTNSKAYGASVFVMGMSKLKANLDVAMRENAAMYLEDNYKQKYDGFDPKSAESYIVFSLMQNTYLEQSLQLAEYVEEQFAYKANRKSRGVKQAPFYVISRTNMPSILVECGFLTNPKEEDYLQTDKGQNQIAMSIFEAVKNYKLSIESSFSLNNIIDSNDINNKNENNLQLNKVIYKVQIATNLTSIFNDKKFAGIKVEEKLVNGIYKYYVGSNTDKRIVDEMKTDLKNNGFKDAFVVAFYNGKRISTKDALNLQKQNN
ncbi:MAG: N-acetylmuramoyl-L-alanine amidase [Flavobacteriales bacterium]|nr:MAG: N-acetylmuramoyl-L-alanine amidase [Flavobacteriales bacterium]